MSNAAIYTNEQLKTVLCLTSLCAYHSPWSVQLVNALGEVWQLAEPSRHGAVTMLYQSGNNNNANDTILTKAESMAVPLRTTLCSNAKDFGNAAIQAWVLVFYTCLRGPELAVQVKAATVLRYDARVSVLLRRLAYLLRIKLSTVAALEEFALIDLQRTVQNNTSNNSSNSNSPTNKQSWTRTLKIGATAVAAGGLLAVTGGLAAPALASGLATLGVASTSLVTTTTVATLCGAGGASLGAVKMTKRTEGLTYFGLQDLLPSRKMQGMTVYICISGFLRATGNKDTNEKKASRRDSKTQSEFLEAPDFFTPWGATVNDTTTTATTTPADSSGTDAVCREYLKQGLLALDAIVSPGKKLTDAGGISVNDASVLSSLVDENKPWDEEYVASTDDQDSPDDNKEDSANTEDEAKQVLDQMEEQLQATYGTNDDDEKLKDGVEMMNLKKGNTTTTTNTAETSTTKLEQQPSSIVERNEYSWRDRVAKYGDQYSLVWQPETLFAIGSSVQNLIKEGITKGVSKGLQYTALNAILAAIALPMTLTNLIASLDESWTVATAAAEQAGKILAETLVSDAHGERPVVLIGYSTGGRVVTSCLSELAAIATGTASSSKGPKTLTMDTDVTTDADILAQKIESKSDLDPNERHRRLRAATVVRDAVIMGAPCDTSSKLWTQRKSVVLGRLINVYNPLDWVLAFLYRYKRWSVLALAGLQQVKEIENYNISKMMEGHNDYANKVPEILAHIGIGDYSDAHHEKYFV